MSYDRYFHGHHAADHHRTRALVASASLSTAPQVFECFTAAGRRVGKWLTGSAVVASPYYLKAYTSTYRRTGELVLASTFD